MTTHGRPEACALCLRKVALTFHHLIPKKVHRRTYFRKHVSRDVLAQGIYVCRKCHSGIHQVYDEMLLAKEFNTLQKLSASQELARHVAWVSRQKS
jgi:5-methylcytosine-specific restriction endonuclease McrA